MGHACPERKPVGKTAEEMLQATGQEGRLQDIRATRVLALGGTNIHRTPQSKVGGKGKVGRTLRLTVRQDARPEDVCQPTGEAPK